MYKDRGSKLLNEFAESLSDIAKVEMEHKMEGKKMFIMLGPKVKK